MKKLLLLFLLPVFLTLTACADTSTDTDTGIAPTPTAKSEEPAPIVEKTNKESAEKPVFLEPVTTDITDGATFTMEPVVIKGDAPADTKWITVNDETLGSFKVGDERFVYPAERKLGNLVIGENVYEIKIYSQDGLLDEQTVVLNFQPDLK